MQEVLRSQGHQSEEAVRDEFLHEAKVPRQVGVLKLVAAGRELNVSPSNI
jgi:hypothetical protein